VLLFYYGIVYNTTSNIDQSAIKSKTGAVPRAGLCLAVSVLAFALTGFAVSTVVPVALAVGAGLAVSVGHYCDPAAAAANPPGHINLGRIGLFRIAK
jgi:hypothetical protein